MKNLLLFCLILTTCFHVFSQSSDSLPPYKQVPIIPPFKILLADSSWFSKADLSKKKSTWIIYFSPDCGHCQLETEEIISNINKLKNLQIVMITSRPLEDLKNFYTHYNLSRFPSIKAGVDPSRFITTFYRVETTPFSAVYNKKGNLINAYSKGANIPELLSMLK